MSEVRGSWLENPWVYLFTVIVVWVVISAVAQTVLLDGELVSAVTTGLVGGIACGITMLYFRRSGAI